MVAGRGLEIIWELPQKEKGPFSCLQGLGDSLSSKGPINGKYHKGSAGGPISTTGKKCTGFQVLGSRILSSLGFLNLKV